VLRLAKPLSENTKRNRSAKVKVTQCGAFLWWRSFINFLTYLLTYLFTYEV